MSRKPSDAHSAEAEREVLGAVLLSPDAYDECNLAPDEFANPNHRRAWAAIGALRDRSGIVDPLTVADACGLAEAEQRSAMASMLSGCFVDVITADAAPHHAAIVRRHAITRRVLEAASAVIAAYERGECEDLELLDRALVSLGGIARSTTRQEATIAELVRDRLRQLGEINDARAAGEQAITGWPTGVAALDERTGGLQPGIVTIVAGRPGGGKSALGMTIADAVTLGGSGVHVFSLEDTRAAYTDRALARESMISAEDIRAVRFTQGEFTRLRDGANVLYRRRGWLVDDTGGLTAEEIVRRVRQRRKDNATVVVVVDYLTKIRRPRSALNAHDGVSQMMLTLSDAARNDGLAYVVMAQLNRECESREGASKRPRLSDLRESGSIEEAAKCVLGVFRPAMYDARAREDVVELLVLKNSNGRTGIVEATWHGPTTRIS